MAISINATTNHVLFTGPPGVGKTTAARQVAELWLQRGRRVLGFYTEEVRSGGRRIGFDAVSFNGTRVALARTEQFASFATSSQQPQARVSAYLVDLPAFEAVAEAALAPAFDRLACGEGFAGGESALTPPALVVVDEVGKMELLSGRFRRAVERLAEGAGRRPAPYLLLCTLPVVARSGDHPTVARFRSDRGNFYLRELSWEDRNAAPYDALARLESCLPR